jgi:DNA-binding transcriptional regulator PaaX
MMKLRNIILQKVAELGEVALDGFFPVKYPEARLWRGLLGAQPSYRFSKPTFSTILSRLKVEGLVERGGSKKKAIWRITKKGRAMAQQPAISVLPAQDGITRIVSFDIPEEQRKKRRWIREELLGLGYRPLQKSVWFGLSPLPENFFEDLDLLSLRNNIEIFSVNKKGTLIKTKPL